MVLRCCVSRSRPNMAADQCGRNGIGMRKSNAVWTFSGGCSEGGKTYLLSVFFLQKPASRGINQFAKTDGRRNATSTSESVKVAPSGSLSHLMRRLFADIWIKMQRRQMSSAFILSSRITQFSSYAPILMIRAANMATRTMSFHMCVSAKNGVFPHTLSVRVPGRAPMCGYSSKSQPWLLMPGD